jgi:hypothetical protein
VHHALWRCDSSLHRTARKRPISSIPSNDPDQSTVDVSLNGSGATEAVPDITMTPTALDFGNVTVGQRSATQIVTVKNDGKSNLKIRGFAAFFESDGAFIYFGSVDDCSPKTLQPTESCTLTLGIIVFEIGSNTGGVYIVSNDPDEEYSLLSFSGTAIP